MSKSRISCVISLVLICLLLLMTACGGSSSSQPSSEESSKEAAVSSSEAVTEPQQPVSSSPDESKAEEPQPEEPEPSSPSQEEESVEAAGGTVADLTAIVTGTLSQQIPGISGNAAAGTEAQRDELAALLSGLKPENVSYIALGNPRSGYADQTLLSDEDAAALIGLVAALPAPGVFETLGNPATGGTQWSLYLETGDQVLSLSDDGFWLTVSMQGQSQLLIFDSSAMQDASGALSAFWTEKTAAAQQSIISLS